MLVRAINGSGGGGGFDIDDIWVETQITQSTATLAYVASAKALLHSKCRIFVDATRTYSINPSTSANRVIAKIDMNLPTGLPSDYEMLEDDNPSLDKTAFKRMVEGIRYNTSTHKYTTSETITSTIQIYSFVYYD